VSNDIHIAVIGLGAMGLPMATRLSGAFIVTACEPDAARRDTAKDNGIATESTPASASKDADVVLLAVRDQAQVEAALFGPDGVLASLKAGAPVILTSTVGPDPVRALGERLARAGFALVDAPVSGGPARAETGDLLIVVGAETDPLDTTRPVLERLASTLTVVGTRPGDGQAFKTVNQLLAGIHIAAAAEAIALARSLQLDPSVVIAALPNIESSLHFSPTSLSWVQSAYTLSFVSKSRKNRTESRKISVTVPARRGLIARAPSAYYPR